MLARLILGIGLLCVAGSLPSNRRQWFYSAFDNVGECVRINHPCNQVFNRSDGESYAKIPNTRGATLDRSIDEFNDFYALLNAHRPSCYLALWSLLCFHYFPQCRPDLPLKYVVTPCREVCEKARRGCVDFLETGNMTWPEHMDCAKFNSSHEDSLCINNTADPELVNEVDLTVQTPSTTASPTSDPPTSAPTTTTTSTTAIPLITTNPPTRLNQRCHSRCNYRTRATGGTFKNNDYTFAANVTILANVTSGTDERYTFVAEVIRLWILDIENCSRFQNNTLILIRSSYSHCQLCPSFNTTAGHNMYLVSGYCNDRGWYMPPNDSLVSPWFSNPKYETRLENWIRNGIKARAQT